MTKKDLSECYIIEMQQLNQENITKLFETYGNFITILVCKNTYLKGVITYGKWVENRLYEDKWINTSCVCLIDKEGDNLYNRAKIIFQNKCNIRSVPVISKSGRLLSVIEKYDSEEGLEKEILHKSWKEFLDLLSDDDTEQEISYLKEILQRSKFLIIGKNYLSHKFCDILDIEAEKHIDIGQKLNEHWDFAVDMDVKFNKIRNLNGIYGKRYVYTFSDLLKELIYLIQRKYFTRWNYLINVKSEDVINYFKRWKTENIIIRQDHLMTAQYASLFCEKGFHVIYGEIPCDTIVDGWINDLYQPDKRYNLVEDIYPEYELKMLYSYIKNLKLDIKILNFYMPYNIPLNDNEKETFVSDNITQSQYERFFGDEHHGNWPELKRRNIFYRYVKKRGLTLNCHSFKDFTFYNGIRVTTSIPNRFKNTIYFLGPCITIGAHAVDDETIESIIQKKINEENIPYRIVNLGTNSEVGFNKRICDLKLVDGDIFVTILPDCPGIIKELPIISLGSAFDGLSRNRNTYFLDCTLHCNALANYRIADFIYSSLRQLIKTSGYEKRQWKHHSLFSIYKNDIDIDEYDAKVNEYLNEISPVLEIAKSLKTKGEIGAIVMNANPFTLGHLHLVEESAKKCGLLYLFVVEEDKSYIPFIHRFDMVKKGVLHLKNVIVIPSGKLIVSQLTMPSYFEREKKRNIEDNMECYNLDHSLDIRIFGKYIAKKMGIKKRFVGEEPLDYVTLEYNNIMKELLPQYGVDLEIIKRKCVDSGAVISASYVRKKILQKEWDEIKPFVPISTYNYLQELYL